MTRQRRAAAARLPAASRPLTAYEPLDAPRPEHAAARLGKRLGFALDQRTVELNGTCATCQDGAAR